MTLNDLYFKTTCNIRPHLLGPMGGLKIERQLYFWLLSVQDQFGVIRCIFSFWHPCIYFWLKYSGIFVLLSLYVTGILLTSKWPRRSSRPLGLLFTHILFLLSLTFPSVLCDIPFPSSTFLYLSTGLILFCLWYHFSSVACIFLFTFYHVPYSSIFLSDHENII